MLLLITILAFSGKLPWKAIVCVYFVTKQIKQMLQLYKLAHPSNKSPHVRGKDTRGKNNVHSCICSQIESPAVNCFGINNTYYFIGKAYTALQPSIMGIFSQDHH